MTCPQPPAGQRQRGQEPVIGGDPLTRRGSAGPTLLPKRWDLTPQMGKQAQSWRGSAPGTQQEAGKSKNERRRHKVRASLEQAALLPLTPAGAASPTRGRPEMYLFPLPGPGDPGWREQRDPRFRLPDPGPAGFPGFARHGRDQLRPLGGDKAQLCRSRHRGARLRPRAPQWQGRKGPAGVPLQVHRHFMGEVAPTAPGRLPTPPAPG